MRQGASNAKRSEWARAREAYEKAWRLGRHAPAAARLAEVEMKLGNYRGAADYWVYYIAGMPPDRAEANARLTECRSHLGSVTITVDGANADVLVNGRIVGRSPLGGAVWLDPGVHVVRARLEDRDSPPQLVRVAAGETQSIAVALHSSPTTLPASVGGSSAAPAQPSAENRAGAATATSRPSSARLFVLAGGSALAASALFTGIFYTIKANDSDEEREHLLSLVQNGDGPSSASSGSAPTSAQGSCSAAMPARSKYCGSLRAQAQRGDEFRRAATAAFIVSGVVGAATATTYLLWPSSAGSAKSRTGWTILPSNFGQRPGIEATLSF